MKDGETRKGERAVTTLDIARHTGLSKMTVSRVLNEFPHVSEETRQKVMEAVKELGFRPNTLAKRFFTGRTQLIAAMVPFEYVFSSFYFKDLLQGILQAAEERGYDVLFHDCGSRLRPPFEKSLDLVKGKLVEGVLVCAALMTDEYPLRLVQQEVPLVVMGESVCGDKVSRVTVPNRAGSADAVQRLTRAGHRHIAMLTYSGDHVESQERLAGYRDALSAAGVPFEEALVLPAWFNRSLASRAIRQLLEERPDVTAVFAANADMALGAADAVAAMKRSIPDDISLVSFDDCPELAECDPPISAVRQFPRKLGQAACELLLEMLAGGVVPKAPRRRIIETEFIERRSIGPAPGNRS